MKTYVEHLERRIMLSLPYEPREPHTAEQIRQLCENHELIETVLALDQLVIDGKLEVYIGLGDKLYSLPDA